MLPDPSELSQISPEQPFTAASGGSTESGQAATLEKSVHPAIIGEGSSPAYGESLPAEVPGSVDASCVVGGVDPVISSAASPRVPDAPSVGFGEPECIHTLDLDGHVLAANAAAGEVLEALPSSGNGQLKSWALLWRAHGCEEAGRAVAAARAGRTMTFEGSLGTRPGISKFWSATVSPIPGADLSGKPERLLAISRAVIRRDAAASPEQAGSDAEFRAAFNQATVGITTTDVEGRVSWANDAFCAMVGYTLEELVGRTSHDYSHAADVEGNRETIQRIQKDHLSAASYEKRYVHRSGRTVWVHINLAPVHDAIGRVVNMVAVIEDITERRQAEQDLANVRRRLDGALTAGEIGTWVYEIPQNQVFADRNLARLFFVPEEEAVHGAPLEVFTRSIHPDDRAKVDADIAVAVEKGGGYETDYRVMNAAGEVRWLVARGTVELDEESKPLRFYGVVLDVTSRKNAQHALASAASELAQQSRMFSAMLSAIDDCTYLLDREGRFIYANQTLLDIYGLPLGEVTGKDFTQLDYPAWHADMHMREVAQVVSTSKPIKGEIAYHNATGQPGVFEYTFSPVFGENGRVEAIAGTSHDVTAQRASQGAIREGKERLDLVVEAARLGTFDWALPEGSEPLEWNQRMREFFGVSPDLLVTRDVIRERVHPDDLPKLEQALDRSVHDEESYDMEYRVISPGTDVRWLRGIGKSFRSVNGTPVRFGGIVMDITAQKHAEQEREHLLAAERSARADAERASKMKDEFLATLSHELRTPLNAILGWAQVLRLDPNTTTPAPNAAAAELQVGLSTIERNARAQAQIIDDLLDMSRIISGKVRLDVQHVELAPVLEAAMATVQPTAEAKGIRLQTILDPQARPVSGDPNRLQQVFWNLLSNAIKFTPKGGRIHVTLARVNSHLEVTITDSGDGIASEFLPHVFDRFRQADASSTRRHGGLGLGLAIVKQLVELHGGSVRALSAGVGFGASFVVVLPVLAALPAGTPADSPNQTEDRRHPQVSFAGGKREAHDMETAPNIVPTTIDLHGLWIVVIDDDADARVLLQHLLEGCGAEVQAGDSAEAGMQLIEAGRNGLGNRVDILISDIGMPGEDGYSFIRRVRVMESEAGAAGQRMEKIPAIALTAYARAEDRMKAVMAGFQMHIAKPVEATELIAMVASLTGRV